MISLGLSGMVSVTDPELAGKRTYNVWLTFSVDNSKDAEKSTPAAPMQRYLDWKLEFLFEMMPYPVNSDGHVYIQLATYGLKAEAIPLGRGKVPLSKFTQTLNMVTVHLFDPKNESKEIGSVMLRARFVTPGAPAPMQAPMPGQMPAPMPGQMPPPMPGQMPGPMQPPMQPQAYPYMPRPIQSGSLPAAVPQHQFGAFQRPWVQQHWQPGGNDFAPGFQ